MLLLSGTGLGLVSLSLAFGRYSRMVFLGYFEVPMIALLNILPAILLVTVVFLCVNRIWIAFALSGVIILPLTYVHNFKLLLRDDPLMMEDLLLAREAGNIVTGYTLELSFKLVFSLICVILGTVFLFYFARARLGRIPRAAGLIMSLACVLLLSGVYKNDKLYYNTINYKYIRRWAATQEYIARGFLYPFLHSGVKLADSKPAGYDKNDVAAILNGYEDADIPEEKTVSVIAIMLEAFADFSRFDIEGLDPSAYDVYHALEAESYTGNLNVSIFGGGTQNTERSFMTGLSQLRDVRSPSNSFMWYLRGQGYTVEGSHSGYAWFYNRANVHEYYGFENYYFLENHYGAITGGTIATDKELFPELVRLYREAHENGKPYFSYNLTYQGHGPYNTRAMLYDKEYFSSDKVSRETYYMTNNYLNSVADTAARLSDMIEFLRDDPEPVVVLVFGDHMPWLGDGNSGYQELGITLSDGLEGFQNYYGTRYLIWGNEAARVATGNSLTGEGPRISPNYLMEELFSQLGWVGPAYMQIQREFKSELPVVTSTTKAITADGELVNAPESKYSEVYLELRRMEYYWRKEKVNAY